MAIRAFWCMEFQMNNERKARIAHEVIIILSVLALLMLVLRLWPVLLLVMLAIIACALRMVFLRLRTVEVIAPADLIPEPPPPDTEMSIVRKAFGLLQIRISENINQTYPAARWVWGVPNVIENFKNNLPLIILLNSAGGYQKAQVQVSNLMFKGLHYITAGVQPDGSDAHSEHDDSESDPSEDADADDDGADTDEDNIPSDEAPINYGCLAFEWVDASMVSLNTRYNEAIAQGQSEILIPSDDLPHPDSWPDVCDELKRSGFSVADFCEDGIRVNITQ